MWLDILCGLIIIIGIIFGYRRGLMSQAGSIIGVILGIIGCNIFASRLAVTFTETTDDAPTIMLNTVMSYIIVFAIAYIVGRLIGSLFARTLKSLHLGILNKVGGAIFMPLEYLLVLSILLNAWVGAFPQTELRSNITGVKEIMLNLAPKVLGSKTVSEVFNSVQDTLKKQSDSYFDTPTDSLQVQE